MRTSRCIASCIALGVSERSMSDCSRGADGVFCAIPLWPHLPVEIFVLGIAAGIWRSVIARGFKSDMWRMLERGLPDIGRKTQRATFQKSMIPPLYPPNMRTFFVIFKAVVALLLCSRDDARAADHASLLRRKVKWHR